MTVSIVQTHNFNTKIKNASQFSWERDYSLGCHICHLEAVCGTEVPLKHLKDITVVAGKFLVERWDICYCNISALLCSVLHKCLGKIQAWHPDDFLPFYSALDILGNTMKEDHPVVTRSLVEASKWIFKNAWIFEINFKGILIDEAYLCNYHLWQHLLFLKWVDVCR